MFSKPVPHHPLGKNGPSVPALGFGLMAMTHQVYGSNPSDEERLAILDRAVELGATFWDTSDLYGDNEQLLAKWFRKTGKRDQIFLASKFGYVKDSRTLDVDSSASYCKKACGETLRNLGIDSIDLSLSNSYPTVGSNDRYYVHNANPQTPIEETMRAMAELKAEGKIKHIGLSTVSSDTIRRAVKIAPVAAFQPEYSLFMRDIEGSAGTNILATCRELGVAVVAATPLGRGMLTSTFSTGKPVGDSTDTRVRIMPRFLEENREQNVKVAAKVKVFADQKGCTVSQLALAWLLKQGDDIFPIPGTKKLEYLEENLGALDVSLTDEEEAEIRAIVENAEIAGGTVPPQFVPYLYRDTREE